MKPKKTTKANLENKKVLFRELGLIVAIAALLVAFEWGTAEKTTSLLADNRGLIEEIDIVPIINDPPPPPPPVVKPPMITDVFDIVNDNEKLPEIKIDTEDKPKKGVDITPYIADAGGYEKPVEDTLIDFHFVDDKPQFMGGDENEFAKWVFKNLTYPESAKENHVQGRVTVEFVVTAQGNVSNVRVLRGVDPALDREAVRVISSSPKWTPGKQRGKAVRVKYVFPVVFQLR